MRKIILQHQKKRHSSSIIVIPPVIVNNQIEEITYFNSYLLPLSQKANIQTALDTYGSVRLEKGDYSGVNIVMKTNQKLFGHSTLNKISNITLEAGANSITINNLNFSDSSLIFQAGGVISNCNFKSLKYVYITSTNGFISNNTFVDIIGQIRFDCSASGYFRNNRVIKISSQGISNQLVMKGNTTTPSYGNVHILTNFLTPNGDASDVNQVTSATFIGVDGEGWNLDGTGAKAMLDIKNATKINITDFSGDNGYSQPVKTPAFSIDSANIFLLNRYVGNTPSSSISNRSNIFNIKSGYTNTRVSGVSPGFDLLCHLNNTDINFNGSNQNSLISDSTTISNITNIIKDTQYTPWSKPNWEILPDPLGINWKTNRVGKPDSKSYIQNLINTNNIAELPEGIFYIGSTLNIPLDGAHGIIGQGTGKTVIVGLTDDFPLITLNTGTDSLFYLDYLTLQGGSHGVYADNRTETGLGQIAYQKIRYVVFRDQEAGLILDQITGMDNSFFDNVSFINCIKGIHQKPKSTYVDLQTCSYIDKALFYKNQFINCTTSLSMIGTRPNNLDIWYGCNFKKGVKALELGSMNSPIIINSELSEFTGTNVVSTNTISIYSSKFFNNTISDSTISSSVSVLEGCDFLDSSKLFSPVIYNNTSNYILNSTVVGDVVVPVPSGLYYPSNAFYSNSSLLSNTSLSKLLVNVKAGVPTVLIDTTPTPYPQLLVTQ